MPTYIRYKLKRLKTGGYHMLSDSKVLYFGISTVHGSGGIVVVLEFQLQLWSGLSGAMISFVEFGE
jgi:hypothetical protein